MPLGIYVSRCQGKVDGVVEIDAALARVRRMAAVVRVVDDFFDSESQQQMVDDVAEYGLDAVVLAGNSIEHYSRALSGHYLKAALVSAGINPNRVIAANILEQVALAHPDDPEGATRKAAALIEVACLRAGMAEPLTGISAPPRHSVMVLGATAEAIIASQRLLQLGFSVVMADRGDALRSLTESGALRATLGYVTGHPEFRSVDHVRLADGTGWVGDYEITLASDDSSDVFQVGGVLLARPDDPAWIKELRDHFKVDVDENGSARSIDPMTHPAETIDPGVMVLPQGAADPSMSERVSAGDSAAMALVLRLSQEETTHYSDVSKVDDTLCGGCASCVRTCAFGACYIGEDGLSHVDVRRCRACGKCVVSCPVGARDIISSPHDYLVEAIRTLAEVPIEGERVLGFLCGGCGYPSADSAARSVESSGATYPASYLPIRIPCGGRLDTLYVLEAFRAGFDAVTVFRCREGHCHNLIGNLDMDRRINLLRTVLRSRRLDDSRLRIIDISPGEGQRFVEQVNEVFATASALDEKKGGRQ